MPLIVDLSETPLTPTEIGVDFVWQTRDGGVGLNGVTQIASPLTGLWELSLVFEQQNEERVRAYRAFKMKTKGRYIWIRVPIFDPFRVRFADAGWPEMPEPVDGPVPVDWTGPVPWSDPTPWAGTDIETTVQIGAIKGAELIVLDTNAMGDALGTGHFISINDYLYLTTRTHTLQGSGGDYYRPFDIGPPLREAIQPGDVVKIGRPTILCRLAEDRSGTIRLKFGRYGQPSMEFIEVLQREAPER